MLVSSNEHYDLLSRVHCINIRRFNKFDLFDKNIYFLFISSYEVKFRVFEVKIECLDKHLYSLALKLCEMLTVSIIHLKAE